MSEPQEEEVTEKVRWWIHTGFAGCIHEGIWDVPLGTTEEELEQWMQDELQNHIDYGFQRYS